MSESAPLPEGSVTPHLTKWIEGLKNISDDAKKDAIALIERKDLELLTNEPVDIVHQARKHLGYALQYWFLASLTGKDTGPAKKMVPILKAEVARDETITGKKRCRDEEICYKINCVPSDTRHVKHTRGVFSSKSLAQAYIPEGGKSRDDGDNVTWHYSVMKTKLSSDSEAREVNLRPENFPYC